MNAYELADELFNYLPSYDAEKFATMLRQQQAELEKLRQDYVNLAVEHQNTLLELKFGVRNERK